MCTLWHEHTIDIYLDIILPTLLLNSKLMTSCYVTHHVTAVMYLFIVQEIKEKEKKRKRKIKSNKIDKKKRKSNIITSFSLTTILHGSAYMKIRKYIDFHFVYCFTIFTNGLITIYNRYGHEYQYWFIRGRLASSSKFSSRESSTHLISSSIPYPKRMEIQSNLLDEDIQKSVDSFQLFYALNNG